MDAVLADLGTRTGTDPSGATVVKAEAVEWPDGSLGCPELGVMYMQVVTPGYQVVLGLDGTSYDYRVAGEGDVIRLCEGLKPAAAADRDRRDSRRAEASPRLVAGWSFRSARGARGQGVTTTWVASLPTGAPPW